MNDLLHRFARFVRSSKGSKALILRWLIVIAVISILAPGSSDVEVSTDEGSTHEDRPPTEAQLVMDKEFPSDEGLVALLVYHDKGEITEEQREHIRGCFQIATTFYNIGIV